MQWSDVMAFFREGTKSTYAAGVKPKYGELGSKYWIYRGSHELLYRDEYRSNAEDGYDRVVGSRIIFLYEAPIWVMSYEGFVRVDEPEVVDLHRAALLEGADEPNFSLTGGRGPCVKSVGSGEQGMRYLNSVSFSKEHRAPRIGTQRGFLDFHGYEEITKGMEHVALLSFDYTALGLVTNLP